MDTKVVMKPAGTNYSAKLLIIPNSYHLVSFFLSKFVTSIRDTFNFVSSEKDTFT